MSLSLLIVSSGLAATAVWLDGTPDAARTPGYTAISAEAAVPEAAWSAEDERAIAYLREELAAVRPLADVFDGELQIMRRLQSALDAVEIIRPEDRDLVWEALIFQGFAVDRYFQDKLESDPAAAPWRVREGGQVEVGPWLDAVALNPERRPTLAELPGEAEISKWQELRARHLLIEPASVIAAELPASGRLVVDGREMATDRAQVSAGYHRIALSVDGMIRRRVAQRLEPDGRLLLVLPPTAAELRALAAPLSKAPPQLRLSGSVQMALSELPQPVQLVVEDRKELLVYDVQGELAVRDVAEAETGASTEGRLVLRAGLGGGWINDGEFFLSNLADEPAHDRATVNAGGLALGLGVELRPLSLLSVGLGLDLLEPLGEHHDLPVGDGLIRLRPYPHLAVGLPWVQIGVGAQIPWRLGVGPRLHLPMGERLELTGAYVYGLGLVRERGAGLPDFEPVDTHAAWMGLSYRYER